MTDIQISGFILCAETGSLSKASEKMFCAPQAISKNLLNMEKELSCTLFHRTSNGLVLTEIGEEYYIFFKQYSKQLNITLHTMKYMYEAMKLNFTIGLSDYLDPYGKLFSVFQQFQDMNGETEFSYRQADNASLLDALDKKEIDVVIMCGSQISNHNTYQIKPFAKEDLYLFLQAGETDEDKQILYDSAYSAWNSQQWSIIAKRLADKHVHVEPSRLVHLPNIKSSVSNVENGTGMAVCDRNFGYFTTDISGVKGVSIQMNSSLVCVWRKDNEHPLIPELYQHLETINM